MPFIRPAGGGLNPETDRYHHLIQAEMALYAPFQSRLRRCPETRHVKRRLDREGNQSQIVLLRMQPAQEVVGLIAAIDMARQTLP